MRYIASDRLISYFNDQTKTVSFLSVENNSYFQIVREHLRKNLNCNEVTTAAIEGDVAVLVKNLGDTDLVYEDGKYFLFEEEIPEGIAKKVLELRQQELPYQPLLNYWRKAKQGGLVSQLLCDEIASLIGTRDIPLTWDGDLILYMRSSWVKPNEETPWVQNYEPGQKVNQVAICGGFTWVSSTCPDAGLMFEVQVNPAQLTPIYEIGAVTNFKATAMTFIGEVKGKIAESGLFFLETKTNTLGDKVVIRAPYSPESFRAYLTTLVPGDNKLPQQEMVSVRLTGC